MGGSGDALPELRFRCTSCGRWVDVCALCGFGFVAGYPVWCRRDATHGHLDCTRDRTGRVVQESGVLSMPEERPRTSSLPPRKP